MSPTCSTQASLAQPPPPAANYHCNQWRSLTVISVTHAGAVLRGLGPRPPFKSLPPVPPNKVHQAVWPHLFCGAGHEKRRGEQLKWSLAFRLYIGSFVFHGHSYQDQFIQPGWAECVLFSLGLHFVCLYCFNLFVCPHPFVFP